MNTRRFSNIFSKISTVPRACVATATRDRREVGREHAARARPRSSGSGRARSSTTRSRWSAGTRRCRARRTPSRRRAARRRARSSAGARRSASSITVISPPVTAARPMNDADLDVVGPIAVLAAAQAVDALDASACSSRCPRSARPSRPAAGTGPARAARRRRWRSRRARREHRGHDRVLGAGDAGLVEEDARAAQAAGRRRSRYARPTSTVAPSAAEGEQVRVDAAAADDVAARRRHVDRALARQQRAGQQDRGADAARRARRRAASLDVGGADATAFCPIHATSAPMCGDELEHGLDVADARARSRA